MRAGGKGSGLDWECKGGEMKGQQGLYPVVNTRWDSAHHGLELDLLPVRCANEDGVLALGILRQVRGRVLARVSHCVMEDRI